MLQSYFLQNIGVNDPFCLNIEQSSAVDPIFFPRKTETYM